MSKKDWRLVGECFLILSLAAGLSLAAADFSKIQQADLKSNVNHEKSTLSQAAFDQGQAALTPILLSSPQYLSKPTHEMPPCLQSR
jgi:hypothetical protein